MQTDTVYERVEHPPGSEARASICTGALSISIFCVALVRYRHAGESYSLVKGLYKEAAEIRARADAAEATYRYCAMAGA